ncbi:MAG: formate dehydrogenase accessory sulfurtransferase FdhD [Candidatus Thalassarchaeaceae archaeon]|jgi:FdhD protein|nr:formate dehydrogenase accessory sulfurtransferase FdhD [Candidatus Thalassarchaeaceae archaeon]
MAERIAELSAQRFTDAIRRPISEPVAIEEPLEIRIDKEKFAITMRTPGDEIPLTYGLMLSEGLIQDLSDIKEILYENGFVNVSPSTTFSGKISEHRRFFNRTSSCGICGRDSIEAVLSAEPPILSPTGPKFSSFIIEGLGEALEKAQCDFDETGGVHAVARFSVTGEISAIAEDVGRHNAMDKLVGQALIDGALPLSNEGLMLSGRVSFEMVQKAIMAGSPILVALGAPTSLAVELARQHGLTLIGFAKEHRFNVYSGAFRLKD